MNVESEEAEVFERPYFSAIHKFDKKPRLPGFNSNVPVVFHDERILHPEEMVPFKEILPSVMYKAQLEMGLEVCNYLQNNGVRDFRIICNFVESVLEMEKELEKMGIGNPATYSSHTQPKPLERLPNSTEVTVVLLFHCDVTNGRKDKRRMAVVLKTAVEASRAGVILLTNKGLLPYDLNDETELGFLLFELISKNDAQVEKYSLELQARNRAVYKQLRGEHGMNPEPQRGRWDVNYSDWFPALLIELPRLGPKNYLELACPRHFSFHRDIFSAWDLEQASPLGGCTSLCKTNLKCGEMCLFACHALDREHKTVFKCEEHLVPQTCSEGHSTLHPCWEEERCREEITHFFSCTHFGAPSRKIKCFERDSLRCKVEVVKELPCGHSIIAECGDDLKGFKCLLTVTKKLECSHSPVSFQCCDSTKPYVCRKAVDVEATCGKHWLKVTCEDFQRKKEWECDAACEKICPRGIHRCATEHPCNLECPPCIIRLDWELGCGHVLDLPCYKPDPAYNHLCRELCQKRNESCPQRHLCYKRCHEECGRCEVKISVPVEKCRRDHVEVMPCFEYYARKSSAPCSVPVVSQIRTDCGHPILVPCHLVDSLRKEAVVRRCEVACDVLFDGEHGCGHRCQGECGRCYQGRFHERCKEPCGKKLVCGHYCEMPCSMVCPPCAHPCYNKCEHWECEKECGVPCEMDCKEPCPYKCEHSSCSNLCSEDCNKPLCYEACKKLLKCGHECIGFCGELCPPYCLECSPEKIQNDPFFFRSDDEEAEGKPIRFLFLPDCGHCLDSYTMERWMTTAEEELQPQRCPICNTRITSFRRYSSIMIANRKVIDSIRTKIFGDSQDLRDQLSTQVSIAVDNSPGEERVAQVFNEFACHVLYELDSRDVSLEYAKFLVWLVSEWATTFERIIQVAVKIKSIPTLDKFASYWRQLFEMVAGRYWPLHPNEMLDLRRELVRIGDAVMMYEKVAESPQSLALIRSKQGESMLDGVELVLFLGRKYDRGQRQLFQDMVGELFKMLKCTLKISPKERVQVLAAFGGRAGRWFKCENGHIYVVTECGGVTQKAKCPECGVLIGGEKHVMVPGNYLAAEMDGAEKPLWGNM